MLIRTPVAALGAALSLAASSQATEIFATHVERLNQAFQTDGAPVIADRSHADFALGEGISGVQPLIDFVTLGIGGSLSLSFDQPFANSLRMYETTWGLRSAWPESAVVEVGVGENVDAADWYPVTGFLNTDPWAEAEPISLAAVHVLSGHDQFDFVRITDTTAALEAGVSYEGIDINAVASESVPEPATLALAGLALFLVRRR